jgi:hypothetical protein
VSRRWVTALAASAVLLVGLTAGAALGHTISQPDIPESSPYLGITPWLLTATLVVGIAALALSASRNRALLATALLLIVAGGALFLRAAEIAALYDTYGFSPVDVLIATGATSLAGPLVVGGVVALCLWIVVRTPTGGRLMGGRHGLAALTAVAVTLAALSVAAFVRNYAPRLFPELYDFTLNPQGVLAGNARAAWLYSGHPYLALAPWLLTASLFAGLMALALAVHRDRRAHADPARLVEERSA